jgi:HicB-like protein involved in pilus formation
MTTRETSSRKPLTLRLDANLEQRLHAAAARDGVSVSQFVRAAITDRLERGPAETSLWDRIAPSVVKRGTRPRIEDKTRAADSHAQLAIGLEAEAAAKWRRLDK